ncbi:thiamine phosphate synthase [Noviherbaspirillum saxi]|uniref:Thiamine-phosphate synthase n=1 Tax=Noviherbaspirillum saxi TaxID=2320863 RepID=A0A3A3G2K4_9BURK|nr:thiamine phosphate synthase [Noviherbaspirillum saxi]RJF95656.1 thiamine phosphate synthase [Noviherbaspirillum saxi]
MRGLYLVTPDWHDTAKLLDITEQALAGGASLVQYRNKTADTALRYEQASQLQALCRRYARPFIVNDFVKLCIELDTDGIHVGANDTPIAAIRSAIGSDKIVGATCYGDLDIACRARQAGASYVAFGGFYPSLVKKYPSTTSPGIVSRAKAQIGLPLVVIGGMTTGNAQPLLVAGADMVAAISSIYLAKNPLAAARDFVALFDTAASTESIGYE